MMFLFYVIAILLFILHSDNVFIVLIAKMVLMKLRQFLLVYACSFVCANAYVGPVKLVVTNESNCDLHLATFDSSGFTGWDNSLYSYFPSLSTNAIELYTNANDLNDRHAFLHAKYNVTCSKNSFSVLFSIYNNYKGKQVSGESDSESYVSYLLAGPFPKQDLKIYPEPNSSGYGVLGILGDGRSYSFILHSDEKK